MNQRSEEYFFGGAFVDRFARADFLPELQTNTSNFDERTMNGEIMTGKLLLNYEF